MTKSSWTERGTRDDALPEQGGSGTQPYFAMMAIAAAVLLALGFCLWSVFLAFRYI